MRDLIDNTPFTMDDIIVLFDPEHHTWVPHNLDVPQQSLSQVTCVPQSSNTSLPSPPLVTRHSLSPNASTASLPPLSVRGVAPPLPPRSPPPQQLTSANDAVANLHIKSHVLRADTNTMAMRLPLPSALQSSQRQTHLPSNGLHSAAAHPVPSQVSQTYHHQQTETTGRLDHFAIYNRGMTDMNKEAAPSFSHMGASIGPQTNLKRFVRRSPNKSPLAKKPRFGGHISSTPQVTEKCVDPQVSMARFYQRKKEEEERKMVYKKIRKGKKGKGYVRVVTNIGHLNIELHCDRVPTTCDNFLTLAERKYYDGLPWHRVVPGFIAQTGDPTGKGDGGESAWGGYIKDEIRTNLHHDAPGIVSMANSGRDTNRSQWFICFDSASHLDGTHTVFGKVVGGLYVLQKMEGEAEMGHPLTVERIEVLVNPIRQIRIQMEKLKAQSAASQGLTESPRPQRSQASTVPTVPPSPLQDRNQKFTHLHPQLPGSNRSLTDEPRLSDIPRNSINLPSVRSLMNAASLSPSRCNRPPSNI
ncbi:Peptidyl-prolyl cis-trans isomerase [Gracilaria domingensis]|nr:Peptidyl-prolyl cis-trans isomerase [Gracilaria domingensis]